jgi:hypothetical protein
VYEALSGAQGDVSVGKHAHDMISACVRACVRALTREAVALHTLVA